MASIREVAGHANAHILSTLTMSAPSKSNTPIPTTTTQSKDWMKPATPELNARTDNETEVVVAKEGEQKRRKQARLAEQENVFTALYQIIVTIVQSL